MSFRASAFFICMKKQHKFVLGKFHSLNRKKSNYAKHIATNYSKHEFMNRHNENHRNKEILPGCGQQTG